MPASRGTGLSGCCCRGGGRSDSAACVCVSYHGMNHQPCCCRTQSSTMMLCSLMSRLRAENAMHAESWRSARPTKYCGRTALLLLGTGSVLSLWMFTQICGVSDIRTKRSAELATIVESAIATHDYSTPPFFYVRDCFSPCPCIVVVETGCGGGAIDDMPVLGGSGYREYYFWFFAFKLELRRDLLWIS